jgi:hypothetical protein
MFMKLAGRAFEGPTKTGSDLKTLPGVFAVITVWHTSPVLVDVDSGANIRESVKKHPRKKIWRKLSKPVGHVFVARYQNTDEKKERVALVNDIRRTMDVPCGN